MNMNINSVVDREGFSFQLDVMLLKVLTHIPVPVAVTRLPDNQLLYVNNKFRELFMEGPLEGRAGQPALSFWCSSQQQEELVAEVMKNGKVDKFEACLKTVNDLRIWALISSVLIEFDGVQGILTSFQDISHLHEIEEDLNNFIRNSETKFQMQRQQLKQAIDDREQLLIALENSKL